MTKNYDPDRDRVVALLDENGKIHYLPKRPGAFTIGGDPGVDVRVPGLPRVAAIAEVQDDGSLWIESLDGPLTVRRPGAAAPRVGRNEPCPCGSGKKFKRCCAN